MSNKFSSTKYSVPSFVEVAFCAEKDCGCVADFRAPIAKGLNGDVEYSLFCKDHARARNLSWNYFLDMSAAEVEDFRHQSYSWHRQTTQINAQEQTQTIHKAMHAADFLHEDILFSESGQGTESQSQSMAQGTRNLPKEVQQALCEMQLDRLPDAVVLKQQFRALAKQYHPDLQRDQHRSEHYAERLKSINGAYKILQHYLLENA